MFEILFWPLVACLLLPGLLVYLGLHVLKREIIFIDIAMAQMASLGTCVAILFHYDIEGITAFCISLAFTVIGSAIFSWLRKRNSEVPLEAIIGIVYVMSAALAVLLLSRAAEGDEQIKNMLVGNILLVSGGDVWRTAGLFAGAGFFHWMFRKQLWLSSFDPERASREGISIRRWDFLFYVSFGLIATSFVRIAGVLLVFTYLIVPATCAIRLASNFASRFITGFCIALIGGVGGLFFSFWFDLPSGAAIVCFFGMLMVLCFAIALLKKPAA
jgi:zinc/manganese transport system permease protein